MLLSDLCPLVKLEACTFNSCFGSLDEVHSTEVFILNPFSALQHVFEALFDINFRCSVCYISITNQRKWTNYLISGRWQTDGSIPQELVDGVTASRFPVLYFGKTRE